MSGSDYAQQTNAFNVIDDKPITQLRRVVCYNQTIYDDTLPEATEFLGLTLGVRDGPLTTVVAQTKPMYDQAVIVILDDDGKQNRYLTVLFLCKITLHSWRIKNFKLTLPRAL